AAPDKLLDRGRDTFGWLHAADRALHRRVEVLDAEIEPRDAELGQRLDAGLVEAARVDLDGELGTECARQVAVDRAHPPGEPAWREDGGRAAAEGEVTETRAAGEARGVQRELGDQAVDVAGERRGIA